MVGHAIYPRLGPRRASFEPETYELLRRLGFRGVAITDSLGVLGSPYAPFWARLALRAGADMVLTTSARDAKRIVDALVPLARAGELDAKLVRICATGGRWRHRHGDGRLDRLAVRRPRARSDDGCRRLGVGVPAERVGRGDSLPRKTPSTRNSTRSARPRTSTRQSTSPVTSWPSATDSCR